MSTDKKPKVLIVGAGIGGLTLAAILERAEIQYEIFEKATSLKPLGSAMGFGAAVMPIFKQLGIADKLKANSAHVETAWMNAEKDMKILLRSDYIVGVEEKFGSLNYVISRPKLHQAIMDLIPPERIHLNKRVLSHVETDVGIIIRTSDNMTHEGNILVGADGTYSAVRQCLYEQLDKKGKLPSSDKEPLKYSIVCLVGQTRPLEPAGYEFPEGKICRAESTLGDKRPYLIVMFTTAERTLCWMVLEFLDEGASNKQHDTFRTTDWGPEAAEAMCNEIRDFRATKELTIGDIIDATPKEIICKVMLEEKLFETWTSGRTVLIGDACHKMNPSAGLGAQSSICDAAVLANYINTLNSVESKEVEKALKGYKKERYPLGKAAVEASTAMAQAIKPGFSGSILRFVLNKMPTWLWLLLLSKNLRNRPQISFLPRAEDKGTAKPYYQPSLRLTRPQTSNNSNAAAAL